MTPRFAPFLLSTLVLACLVAGQPRPLLGQEESEGPSASSDEIDLLESEHDDELDEIGPEDDDELDETDSEDDQLPQAEFAEAIHVKVINVQTFVRDKKGNPITGLTADDFEIYENGKLMPMTNFYEVSEGERTDRPPEKEPPRPGIEITSGIDPRVPQVPEDERLHLVIYIDHFNITPFNRNRIFRYLRQFLRTHVDRQDRVMLMSYNRSLKMERPFTSDPVVISNALYSMEKTTGGRVQVQSEERDLLREIDDSRDPYQMEGRIRLYAENVFNDLQFTLDALKEMVMGLAGIPGRKAILYVSEGLPMRAGEEFFYAAEDKTRMMAGEDSFAGYQSNLLDALQYDASRRFRDLTNHANANDVTFYTLDAGGLRTSSLTSAETSGYNTTFSSNFDSVKVANLQSTIQFMADRTGGQSIVNTNNFDAGFDDFGSDFNHYYSLGYSPGHAGNGRSYRIEVKLKDKKGRRIRHRLGYRDKSVEDEMADRTTASLRYSYENNALGIQLERGESIRRSDGNYVVHMDVKIPIGELALIPTPDGYVARVRVWVQALDQKGATSEVQANVVQWAPIPTDDIERAKKAYYVYSLPLVMRNGEQRIAIGVRDDMAGRTSFVSRALNVGS